MMPGLFARLLSSRPPAAAVEIAADRVTAAVLSGSGGARTITSYASEPLPPGAVEPALNADNVHQRAVLAETVHTVLGRLSPRPTRIALVLPDTVAKVSLLRFEKIPPKAQDLEQLIRWQVRKAAPFRIEDALVAWVPGIATPEGGREYIVTAARRDILESYEAPCVAAGAHPGIVDLASLNLVNAAMAAQGTAGASGDWLLVHVAPGYGTIAVVRGATIIFFRNRVTSSDEDLVDLVHQTSMYHEDRLGGGGFVRVVLAGSPSSDAGQAARLRRHLEERLAARVEPMDFRGTVTLRDRITASADLIAALAPSVGVLLRERAA